MVVVKNQLRNNEYKLFPYVKNPEYLAKYGDLIEFEGIQKLVMLDRYSVKDIELITLKEGDEVVVELKGGKYKQKGYGKVIEILGEDVVVSLDFPSYVEGVDVSNIVINKEKVEKPLELYWNQIAYRVANGLSSVEKSKGLRRYWFKQFYHMLVNMYVIPAGRVLYGAGTDNEVTLYNCFVLGYMDDSRKGIARHRETVMEIMSRGGGVGTNGSTLRPRGEVVKKVRGKSSGSVSWLNDLSSLTDLVQQGGSRRGAQMIALADWHPDVVEFIMCKIQNPNVLDLITKQVNNKYIVDIAESLLQRDKDGKPIGVHDKDFMSGANISVLVSNDFMNAVMNNEDWVLRFPDVKNLTKEQMEFYDKKWSSMGDVRKWEEFGYPVKEYTRIKAKDLWKLINIAARYSAEPGVIFIDHCNNMSNSYYYAPLVVTNPCGEQPLPANGVCNLLSINMAEMVDKEGKIKWDLLKKAVWVSQRMGDNVIDHSYYFLKENEQMAKLERRVGKGVLGLADFFIYLKMRYGSNEMLKLTDKVFNFIKEESYKASAYLAKEKGVFPLYIEDKYLNSNFVKQLSDETKELIEKYGVRNVCSLTVAPTGSIGTMLGVSTGLEPYFAFKYYRAGRLGFVEVNTDIAQKYFDENPDKNELPSYFVSAMDLTPLEHIKVQGVIQKHVDSAISKTCNAPRTFTVQDNMLLYELAWKLGCKGVTVYVDGSREEQVLMVEKDENKENENYDDLTNMTLECKISFDSFGNMIKEC